MIKEMLQVVLYSVLLVLFLFIFGTGIVYWTFAWWGMTGVKLLFSGWMWFLIVVMLYDMSKRAYNYDNKK